MNMQPIIPNPEKDRTYLYRPIPGKWNRFTFIFPLFIVCVISLFFLPVSAVAPMVSSITPSTGANTTSISITDITGTGISGPASVKLTQGLFSLSHKGSIANGGVVALNQPYCVFVDGNYAYLASANSNALEIVNITNKSNPVHEGSIVDGAGGARLAGASDVYISGNYAYVASENSNALEIVNVANPAAPVHAGSITDGSGGAKLLYPVGVHVSGNYAYIVSGFGNSLEIVDVSNPAAPVHRGSMRNGTYAHLDFPMNVYVSGNRAYVASGTNKGLEVVDVSDPTNPRQEAFLSNGIGGVLLNFPYDVQVAGNYAYVAARDSNALEIIDLADTTWYPKIYGTAVNVASATKINAVTFDLTNRPPGLYNVIVSNYNGEQGVLVNGFTVVTASPTIAPTSGSTSSSGGSDSDNSGPQSGSYAITSPGADAGQSMNFVTGETNADNHPYAIISVTVVPKEKRGQTELIYTHVTDASLPGNRRTAGIVSIVLVGVNPTTVDHGVITFAISKPWLEQHGLLPKDLVLMRNTNGIWSELPTIYDHETNGAYYYTATTPGFSYFAISTRNTETTGNTEVTPSITPSPNPSLNPVSITVEPSETVIKTVEAPGSFCRRSPGSRIFTVSTGSLCS